MSELWQSSGQLQTRWQSAGQLPYRPPVFSPADIANIRWFFQYSHAATVFEDTARTDAAEAGDSIAGVTDQSGQGNHISLASAQATYASAVQNGKNAAHFSGSTQYQKFPPVTLNNSGWYVAWVGAVLAATPSLENIFGHSSTTQLIRHDDADTLSIRADDSNFVSVDHVANPLGTAWAVYEYIRESGGTFRFYRDGTELANVSGVGPAITFSELGRRAGIDYAELHMGGTVGVNGVPTTTERSDLRSYWYTEFAITGGS